MPERGACFDQLDGQFGDVDRGDWSGRCESLWQAEKPEEAAVKASSRRTNKLGPSSFRNASLDCT